MAMNGPSKRGALSEINVTPLVDVMLVLLVVFMVTTPIIVEKVTQRKVEVNLPTTNAKPVKPDELQTLLVLHPSFKIGLDLGEDETAVETCPPSKPGYDACMTRLQRKLKANQPLQDGRRVFLMADRDLPYGFVVDVMARLKNAGITNLGMVTNPPPTTETQ